MSHLIKVTITVYVLSMFLYSVWYILQYYDFAGLAPYSDEWIGSLCYLPHGARVLMFCAFRYYSLPGLYLAEITGPSIHHNDYLPGWSFAAIASLFSVIAAVELVKWTRATPGFFSFFKKVSFENYKFVMLVVIVSALLNGILVNLVLSLINPGNSISALVVFRFAVGDFLGACAVIAIGWVIFKTLTDTRLIISPED